jgi:hypothetical protein
MLNWIGPTRRNRMAVQDVHFLYYDGQPRQYSPKENPDNLLFQLLAVTASPADLQGTAALSWRFRDPTKRDLSWAYAPAIRRVRAISPANRSDGFLGSDQSQDDGFFFDGKPEDFVWKIVDHRDGMRLVDPWSIKGEVKREPMKEGGWRTISYNNDKSVGFMDDDWKGIAWAPAGAGLAHRKFWVIEGVPKVELDRLLVLDERPLQHPGPVELLAPGEVFLGGGHLGLQQVAPVPDVAGLLLQGLAPVQDGLVPVAGLRCDLGAARRPESGTAGRQDEHRRQKGDVPNGLSTQSHGSHAHASKLPLRPDR